jgi:hypothetical protein
MTWRATLLLTLAVLAARVVYLVFLCQYELFGDEAFCWEWSRRLGLCYYEKGPGIAYLIAASTALFGDSEWAVRLPMAVASAGATLALARLATAGSQGDQRVGFLAALTFTLMPAYQGNAQICTQDGPLITVWILGCWAAWHLFDRLERGRAAGGLWLVLGAVFGLGFLFKQSMLLLAPGLLLYALLRARRLPWGWRLARGVWLSAAAFLIVVSPMLIWNYHHGWPTLAHTLGHLGAPGGDQGGPSAPHAPYDPAWTVGLILAQIGAFGPPAVILIVQAIVWSVRTRKAEPQRWPARLLMLCCAAPSLIFYTALTFWKKAEANWPFPAFATLLVLVAQLGAVELPRQRRLVDEWRRDPRRPRPWRGWLRRRPETLFQVSWDWVRIYGLAAWLLLCFLPNFMAVAARWGLPVANQRFAGQRDKAARISALVYTVEAQQGQRPFLVASHYMDAALKAFYLPGHPVVYNAGSLMRIRMTSYDFWPDTDLRDPGLQGRPAVLIGTSRPRWEQALSFDALEPLDDAVPAFLGLGYRGPRSP